MKHLLLAGLVLGCVSCGYEDLSIKYRPVRTEVDVPSVNHDTGGELQYMSVCADGGVALSGWESSHSAATSKAGEHVSAHAGCTVSVLWRQKPGGRLVPKHPRG